MKIRKIVIMLILVLALAPVRIIYANASSIITFNDTNLKDALCKSYKHEGDFSKEEAKKLSSDKNLIIIE